MVGCLACFCFAFIILFYHIFGRGCLSPCTLLFFSLWGDFKYLLCLTSSRAECCLVLSAIWFLV